MSEPVSPARNRSLAAALGAAVVVATAAGAGAALGPAALALAVPAALAGAMLRGRSDRRTRRLLRQSRQDTLTGLGNRLLLAERLDYEMLRHARHERPLTALALDLDGFKAVNDRFGHAAGDEVLVEIARALRRAVRAQDTVVRSGGDEFCVLAPETDRLAATLLAHRLEDAVAGAAGGMGAFRVAASVGFALYPHDARDARELLERADGAALVAKRRARADAAGTAPRAVA